MLSARFRELSGSPLHAEIYRHMLDEYNEKYTKSVIH